MINYGVIGCGVIGHVHCKSIIGNKDSRLHSVWDIKTERMNDFSKKYSCNTSQSLKDLLNNKDIDVITICLPHFEHFKMFQDILFADKHVICEKPLAINFEDLYEMVDLSLRSDLLTTVAFQHRHSILVQKLKSLIVCGTFGEIISGEIKFSCTRGLDYYNRESWRGKWATEGGGTLINQAIHTIDLANLFMGRPISVNGIIENKEHPDIEVEDFSVGYVNYRNSYLKIKAVNNNENPWEPLLKITGTKGNFTLLGSNILSEINLSNTKIINEIRHVEKLINMESEHMGKDCYSNLHMLLFKDFTESLIENKRPLNSINECSYANEIVLGLYQSSSINGEVSLPIKIKN